MAQIAVAPFVMRDCILTIGTDSYEKHISSVTFTPQPVSWRGLSPAAVFTDTSIWQAKIEYAQDWETTNSLSQYLLAEAGESKAAVFTPKAAGAETFSTNLAIAPGPIGGTQGQVATATVTLECSQPVFDDGA